MNDLTLRPFADRDITLLTAWLHKDYILKWYQDPAAWLEEIHGRHAAFAWISHFIVLYGDTPIGFCQYYDCVHANALEDWYEVTRQNDTYSIDYLIGEGAYLGKGCGKAVVRLLTERIAQEGARQIIVQPDSENQPSSHVLLANGFVFDAALDYYVKTLETDPFYSESNLAHLRRGVTALNSGNGMERDIINE